ncbi:alpha/beta hydrolase [Marinobacter sp.]|uniref:alpha/beta fold hydrolase n=1 Tax=Marinobacter sp. TaxID=50741 RepID=UPI002B278DCA|nr:alpha/beta hydrolase [Marinobacter sp.]
MNDAVLAGSRLANPAGCREAHWSLQNIELSGLIWPSETHAHPHPSVIMVHGWLDNAMTFAHLAPELSEFTSVHAIDMAGHGHSGHRPPGYGYWLTDYVADLCELIDVHFSKNEQQPLDLVGHSLGGIVCALYAAAYPERVRRLVMIDSIGALSRPAKETIPQLRRALQKKRNGSAPAAVYSTVESAAKIREGGLSPLSPEAATTLVPRNMREHPDGFVWRTDARLRHPTALMMTEEQVQASLSELSVPTLFIRARQGLLAGRQDLDKRVELIPDLTVAEVPGGHHCHLDGDTAPVASAIKRFLFDA